MLKKTIAKKVILIWLVIGASLGAGFFSGCDTPSRTRPSHTRVLTPDQDDSMGGSFIESSDVRTMAQQMSTQLISLPEIDQSDSIVYIATDNIKNSTRHLIDAQLILRRLRLEINKHTQGQFRFFAQGAGQRTRQRILGQREKDEVKNAIKDVAQYIGQSDLVQNADAPLRIKVSPVANTNLFNMNADSFASLLRSEIKGIVGEKILFSRPGFETEVDYTLTGEFFAQSIKEEGIANTVEDLKWAQENPELWHETDEDKKKTTVHGDQININAVNNIDIKIGPNLTYKLIEPELWNSPNVTKTFNIMLVNKDELAVLEKSIDLEKEIKSGLDRADYILTGELSALSKAEKGSRSDYVLVSFFLIDPDSNEILWEYGYEVKRVTTRSVLYR